MEINNPYATIRSPKYPQSYPKDVDCNYVIRFDGEQKVVLEFHDFNLEHSKNCRYVSLIKEVFTKHYHFYNNLVKRV